MAQQQTIEAIISSLGQLQGQSASITTLAQQVKRKQQQLKLAVDSAVRVIASLSGATQQVNALLQRANVAKDTQQQFITQINTILGEAPNEAEVTQSINDLKNVVESSGQQGVLDQQARTNIGLAGGFNWRSQSNRPKKSTRITRRRSKSKTKSRRTTRNKGKKSIRKSKSN